MPPSGTQGYKSKNQARTSATKTEDGPQPMKNCKPSKITPNSADQFTQSHQGQYETRGKPSDGAVDRVQQHSTAHPVLREQLDKRRSTTRVTAVKARRGMTSKSICSVCLKLKRNKRKKTLRSRCQGRRNRQHTRRSKYRSSKCTREIYRNRDFGKLQGRWRRRGLKGSSPQGASVNGDKTRSDVGSSKEPTTAESSVTSYHTYPSLDHEPMVS